MNKIADIVIGTLFVLIGILIMVFSVRLPHWGENLNNPGMLPFLVGMLVILCSFSIIVSAIKNKVESINDDRESVPVNLLKWSTLEGRRTYIFIISTIIYVLAIKQFHFYLPTVAFLPITIFLLGVKSPIKILSITIISPLAVYLIFNYVFNIMLP